MQPSIVEHRAGLSVATEIADLDFETFSSAGFVWDAPAGKWRGPPNASQGKKGLFVVGAAVYAEHQSTEVLSCWYDLKDGRGRRFWRPGLPNPVDLFAHVLAGGLLEAHNKGFESHIWRKVCAPRYGWPGMPAHQWRCSMAKARAHNLPGGLEMLGGVLRIENQKDKEGARLLEKFSWPRNPTKGDPRHRIVPAWTSCATEAIAWYASHGYEVSKFPKGWQAIDHADTLGLSRYNERDIVAEAEASIRIPDLPPFELRYWQVDQAINERGAYIDGKALHDCIAIVDQCLVKYNAELQALTGGAVDRASELAKLSEWLRAQGVPVGYGRGSTDEEAIDKLLDLPNLPPQGRRALEIRKAAGSASVKKVFAMRNQLTAASRLHDLFSFHGARTGRPTGNGPQPTNLPSGGPKVFKCLCGRHHGAHTTVCPWCKLPGAPSREPAEWSWEAAADALEVIAHQRLDLVETVFGHALATVGGCLRGLYCAAPGHDLICSDYSAIEAVILAFLAREQWRMDVFNTHGKIYETSASKAFGVPLEEFDRVKAETGQHHHLRKKGKGLELSGGYQGWIGAAKQFGVPGTDDEIKRDILKWRAASPSIEWLWGGQTQGKANGPLANSGRVPLSTNWKGEPDRWDDRPFYFGVEGAAVLAVLNAGTVQPVINLDGQGCGVSYLMTGDKLYCQLPSGRVITYHSPSLRAGDRGGYSLSFWGYNTNPKNGPIGWIQMDTWGGRLVENIVQAIGNDFLRAASVALEEAGYPIVLHVYDEIACEVPKGFGSIEEVERIMALPQWWAPGWPIKAAGGWRGLRYRKG